MIIAIFTPENLGSQPDAYVGSGFTFDGNKMNLSPVQKLEKARRFQTDAVDAVALFIDENYPYVPIVCDDNGNPMI